MKLFIVRHGESVKNLLHVCNADPTKDYPLTEKGRKQAQELAKKIKEQHFDIICTSELPRAQETAEILGEGRGIPIIADERLNEVNQGIFEGRLLEDLRKFNKGDRVHNTPDGGETPGMLLDRMLSCVMSLKEQGFREVLIVSHGDPIQVLRSHLENIPLDLDGRHPHYPETCALLEFTI